MKHFKKITYMENRNRITILSDFRLMLEKYFGIGPCQGKKDIENVTELRKSINQNTHKVISILVVADSLPTFSIRPAFSNVVLENVDIFSNIFRLDEISVEPIILFDVLDRAIGLYCDDKRNAIIRTFNPFFWIGLVLDYIVSLPFAFIGNLGFDEQKAESSLIGKIIKGLGWIITIGAAITTILGGLGCLSYLKHIVKDLIK